MKNLLIFEDFTEVLLLEKNIPTNPKRKVEKEGSKGSGRKPNYAK
jgi:hypothetical protein